MKTKHYLVAALCGLAAASPVWAEAAAAANPKVKVELVNPEKFTDVRDAFQPSDKGQLANAEIVRDYIAQKAAAYVPDGYTLNVAITNIDLAGDFEPWGKSGTDDVRIVKDLYPPRIDLNFKLIDSAGHVAKEGSRELRDLNFLMKIDIRRSDSFRHEKSLIDDWINRDLRPAKSS
ncbi:MAG: DUF3016 domain-containing protein [Opitutaceae bacterium]|nr:DUF3016 domain-containing protein [Opitutaceae bacterium]